MKKILTLALLGAMALGAVSCGGGDDVNKPEYTVTFNADGGTPAPASQKVKEGDTATAPPTVTKTGYVFMFWSRNGADAYNFSSPVTSNITLTAHWQSEATVEYWQVEWRLDGGAWPSGDDHATQVVKGGTLAEPAAPTKTGSTFEGWYKEEALTNRVSFPYDVSAVTANFTLYAKWTAEGVEPTTRGEGLYIGDSNTPVNLASVSGGDILTKTMSYIYYAGEAAEYTLVLESDVTKGSGANSLQKGATLTIVGKGEVRTITGRDNANPMLGVSDGTLILEDNLIFKGKCSALSVSAGINTDNSATAIMRGGCSIQVQGYGPAVSVGGNGNFVMESGSITGNVSPQGRGGGVDVSSGTFTMKGGTISGNYAGDGGGVSVSSGTFIMEGGWIGDNHVLKTGGTALGIPISGASQGYGGGVYVSRSNPDSEMGRFIMKGGTVYGNNSEITPNKAQTDGAALYVRNGIAEYGDGTPITFTASGGYNTTLYGRN